MLTKVGHRMQAIKTPITDKNEQKDKPSFCSFTYSMQTCLTTYHT